MDWIETGGGRLQGIIKLQREISEEILEDSGKRKTEQPRTFETSKAQ
jgi:hypothetical protein